MSSSLRPESDVTLVIPGRNAASTVRACLDSVVPLLESGQLAEIIFVNDGSTDETAAIVAEYPVRQIEGAGEGPGAARNRGWRAAGTPLIWFIDSDCVAEPDALALLRPELNDPGVAGAGGSYGNMFPHALLACLIHEEIIERHRRMPADVNFLATFNVLYRRDVLEAVDGFDESLKLAQDAELAYRIRKAEHRLRFVLDSRVRHHHPRRLRRYLRTQARQGFYRVQLYARHPEKMSGDSYAGLLDYAQPPLALLMVASLPLVLLPWGWSVPLVCALLIAAVLLPMTLRMTLRTRHPKYLLFLPMAAVRAVWRGVGMALGLLAVKRRRRAAIVDQRPAGG
ncbi:Putative glycosyltransferase EpsH [Maioricimonas rarisocia]|uniref:Glycosyltransferase EpsH n=1 Tax=Maioricimonas rarisocia TaxID=2528026 RepID=A0A517Z195_9PLAN|nr:glycosyltransferase [Maioricimonas rarisocia]QDU36256.1 Putative glycosyltransferase EpsH [Maioricimonas rarisocia]